ncbi:MAG: response regulator [Syntrophobacterales bacterium]|nr:response regulator [Syntrophobacterales bacterium]
MLVVDDEEVIREGIRRILEAEGYQVQTAASGQAAGEKIQTKLNVHNLLQRQRYFYRKLSRGNSQDRFDRSP